MPDLSIAARCLQQTTPSLRLQYPENATSHYLEVRHELRSFLQRADHRPHLHSGYGGPWLENRWIRHFEPLAHRGPLSSTFGPFIPIFVPWTDWFVHWHNHKLHNRSAHLVPPGFPGSLQRADLL